jgi:CubicO group peptidase (beta-lactamase class C family)
LNIAKISGRNEIASYLQKLGAKEVTLPTEETIIDGFYASLKESKNSAIALLVAIEGKAIYKKAFGYEDIKRKKQATLNTKFKIASITKQVIGAAILKLQENHLLRVTDKLSKYIPDFPRGDEVTLHHLLTHTSGIHNYFSEPALESKFITSITEEELINSFKNKPFDFNPGEKFKYNNSGYFLLGYIIGKVSGKPYGTYLKETFFDPLQMHNTGIHYAGIKLENEAKGYFNNNGTSVEASSWDMSWVGAAGAMYSTLDDLNKWNQAVFSGTVLKAESLKAALSPVVLNNGKNPDLGGLGYGYGWASSTYRGVERIWHMGLVDGFSSRIAYFPKTKMTVVMLANSLPDVVFDENIIAEVFLWKTMEKQD